MHVVFDLDGTLTDPEKGISSCFAHALEALGMPVPPRAALRACIGPPLRESFAALLGTQDPARIERATELYRERFSVQGLFENELHPGADGALQELCAAGHRLYVATTKPRDYAVRIVEHFGLQKYFVRVYGSEISGARSDKAELLGHLLREEAVPADRTVMIGDRVQDIEGARANALVSIGVLWGYGSRQELAAADYLVDTWDRLVERVQSICVVTRGL